MNDRDGPTLYQVQQGIDLMSDDAQDYQWSEYNFTVGFGAFKSSMDFNPVTVSLDRHLESIDISELLILEQYSLAESQTATMMTMPDLIRCQNSDTNLDFIYKNALCLDQTQTSVKGNPQLYKGTKIRLFVAYQACIFDRTQCSESQTKLINEIIDSESTIFVELFSQELYLDYYDYENPFKLRTKTIKNFQLFGSQLTTEE